MWALGLDTSGTAQCVALVHSDGRVYKRHSAERRLQGEIVQPFITECVAEAGIKLKDIGVIAAVTGPGSFTGLRIALAMAQGMTRALGCQIAGYDRFTLLRAVAPEAVIVFESLRAELYVQLAPNVTEMLPAADIIARLDGRAVLGDGATMLGVEALTTKPEAELAALKALADLATGAALPPALPFYVRPPDVTMPKAAP